jgi:outer membrane protein OmpA-like peptidoglycan-associated protein/tetratricopeptide (TPR) repeat protein
MFFKKIIAVSIFHFFIFPSFAQWYTPENVKPKAVILYNKGIEKAQNRVYIDAVQYLQKAIEEDPKYVDAYLSIGGIQGERKDYGNSVNYYEKAFALDSLYTQPYLLPYSINCAGQGKFEKALKAVQQFKLTKGLNEKSLKSADYRIKSYEFAIQLAKDNKNSDYIFTPRNLGDSVNSGDSEYFPSVTIDGGKLVFTRRVRDFNEDFFETDIINKQWTKSKPIKGDVNTEHNEGAQCISQDGTMLFFTGCNFPNGQGSCDLYYSLFINNQWTKPIAAGSNINTEYWESQPSLSPDKRTLYFTARDPISIGGSDIYVSYMDDKGKWGVPKNLGKTINTTGDESCPFIHADNQTLYFTSNGHTGYGGEDLFLSRKDTQGKWTTPVNLGYPINTIENEGSLTIAADGITAYYASDRADSKGGLDLYTFPLRKDIQPIKTYWVQGKVYDVKTNKGLNSTVELIDLASNQIHQKVQTNDLGEYFITLPIGKDYAFNVNRKGYLFYSGNYSLSKNVTDTIFKNDIPLQPLDKDAMIVLNNVFYETNQFNLKPESIAELDKVVLLLKENPTLKIEISGHTDNVGVAKTNLTLSNKRAQSVTKYLVSKGIVVNRLTAKGYGSTKAITDNKTEQGKAKNRRTELKIIAI